MIIDDSRLEEITKKIICISCGIGIQADKCYFDDAKVAAIKKIIKTEIINRVTSENPFCDHCKEGDCVISVDDTCALIRQYTKFLEGQLK